MKNAIEVCFNRVSLVGIGTKSLWVLSDTPCKLQFKISPPRGEKAGLMLPFLTCYYILDV